LWPDEDPEDSLVPHHALLDVYQSVDRSIGQILEGLSLDETTVIIFSLHGMESNTSQEHFVPMIMDRVNKQWVSSNETGASSSQAPKQLSPMRWLRENVPLRLQHAIAQAVPVGIRDWVVTKAVTGGYDWPNTPGFPLLADLTGYLRFNIRGREKLGMLEAGSDELSNYTQWLRKCLESIRIPDSAEPLIDEVCLTNQTHTGARSHHLPDAILKWKNVPEVSAVHSDILGNLNTDRATGRGGNHRPEGFCIILGEGLRSESQKPGHIADLAPMILENLLQHSHGYCQVK
jgi:predicted AlkP superfamily phosphohydrolase/phosphomutase